MRRRKKCQFLINLLLCFIFPFTTLPPLSAIPVRSVENEHGQILYEDWNYNEQWDIDELWWVDTGSTLDSDNDGLTDAREAAWLTNPYNPDSDYDGITDGDEVDLFGGISAGFHPLYWDTNSNGFSDHDEAYGFYGVDHNTVGQGYSCYDWDGDGFKNPEDPDPFVAQLDPLGDDDMDGYENAYDSHPYDPTLWYDWDGDGHNEEAPNEPDPLADDDIDGHANQRDSHPWDSALWSDWDSDGFNEGEGPWDDRDGDGYLNEIDSHAGDPNLWTDWNGDGLNGDLHPWANEDGDGYFNEDDSHPYDPYLWSDWDGDLLNDTVDSHPYDSTLWDDWNDNGINDSVEYEFNDFDGDGYPDDNDSHYNNATLWNDWNYNDVNDENEADSDYDGILDIHDSHIYNASLWDDWNYNYVNDSEENGVYDYDGDGYADDGDSHWTDPSLWNDWDYNGINNEFEDDADNDGYPDIHDSNIFDPLLWEDWNSNGFNDSEEGSYVDNDNDGYVDDSDSHPIDPSLWSDWDDDGINAEAEVVLGTNPFNPDTDGDGLLDSEEVTYGTNPLTIDSDTDGLTDYEELAVFTAPLQGKHLDANNPHSISPHYLDGLMVDAADSDADGIPDTIENFYASAMDPYNPADALGDLDADHISNLQEYQHGTRLDGNLQVYDHDRDGMTDLQEDTWNAVYPGKFNKYWFDDSVQDPDGDGVLNFEEVFYRLDPGSTHTHSSAQDLSWINQIWGKTWTEPITPDDADGDGLPDVWEHRYFLDVRSPDAGRDEDGDHLSNLTEFRFNTHPRLKETQSGVTDNTSFHQHNPPQGPTSTTTPGGLLQRYRAQIMADLDHSSTMDKSLNEGMGWETGGDAPTGSPSTKTKSTVTRQVKLASTGSYIDEPETDVLHTHSLTISSGSRSPDGGGSGGSPDSCCTGDSCASPGCVVCNSTGKRACSACPPEQQCPDCFIYCYSCGGTEKCGSCSGTGSNKCGYCDYYSPPEQCVACNASGTVNSETCTECFGLGYFPKTGNCYTCNNTGLMPCSACWGSGDCKSCSRTGWCNTCFNSRTITPPCSTNCEGGIIDCEFCTGSGVGSGCLCGSVDCTCGNACECGDGGEGEDEFFESVVIELLPPEPGEIWGTLDIYIDGGHAGVLNQMINTISISAPDLNKSKSIDLVTIVQAPPPDTLVGGVSVSDSSGPRYRKIGLNGIPLPDAKPQVQDESGQNPEETYIDAFNRQLRHSVSDVYVEMSDSLLPLMVRRDVATEIWNNRSGLRPNERPEAAFGVGWSSNLCAYIRFETLGRYSTADMRATVADEQGSQQSFMRQNNQWHHSRDEKNDIKTVFNTLASQENGKTVLTKKFGTVCEYEPTAIEQILPGDRIDGQGYGTKFTYARLSKVTDRWGNQLVYEYSSPATLIPSRIIDPARPGHEIQIKQSGGLVSEIRGPGGDSTHYTYTQRSGGIIGNSVQVLSQLGTVTRGGETVSYDYQFDGQLDPTPADPEKPLTFFHFDLQRITDEMGRQYSFYWTPDLSAQYEEFVANTPTIRYQMGQPHMLNHVTSPAGSIQLSGSRNLPGSGLFAPMSGQVHAPPVVNVVVTPDHTLTYTFSAPTIFYPDWGGNRNGPDDSVISNRFTVNYCQLETKIQGSTGAPITESYEFHPAASMALKSATDASGNTTTYEYEQLENRYSGLNGVYYDDPVKEINALGQEKIFTYAPDTRVMASMTDARGIITTYDVEPVTGIRRSELITGPDGSGKHTFYQHHPLFKGMVVKETTTSNTLENMPPTVVLTTLGQQTTDTGEPNPGWWRERTQTVGEMAGETFIPITTSTTIYDFGGSKQTVIDGLGRLTNFGYDAKNRLTSVAHDDGSTKTFTYDARGNQLSEVNENGVTTFHAYDSLNRRISTTIDLNGNGMPDPSYTTMTLDAATGLPSFNGDIVQSTTYTARNLVATQTDPAGKLTAHTYDVFGRLTKTDDAGLITTFAYGANSGGGIFDVSGFKPTQVTDPRNVVTTFVYDKLYRPVSKTVAGFGSTITQYDASGNPVSVTDPLGRTTQHVYDALGQVTETIHPDDSRVRQSYTHHGKLYRSEDEAGAITQMHYDAAGQLIRTELPAMGDSIPTVEYTYDGAGNQLTQKGPLGAITYTFYDVRNRPVQTASPPVWDAEEGEFVRLYTTTAYDALGQVISVEDTGGAVTTKSYDRAGRTYCVTDALGHQTRTTFDSRGNILTVTNALGNTTTNTYDIHSRLVSTVDAASIPNTFQYDAAGNRTHVVDGLGQQTNFVYDGLNRLVSQTFANGDTVTHSYNAVQKISQTSPRGITTTFTYDDRDRMLSSSASAAAGAAGLERIFSYDLAGRLLSVTESGRPEAAVSYTYDLAGRMITETSRGLTHTYTYDLAGNRTRAAYGTGRIVESSYDALNRPETLAEGSRMTTYGYDRAGRAVILILGNGQVTENVHDLAGRLTNRTLFRSLEERSTASGVLAEFGWTYNALGNVTAQHETWPGTAGNSGIKKTILGYDAASRLTQEVIEDPNGSLTTTVYAYDAAHNRASKTVAGGSSPGQWDYHYNTANQLTSWEKRAEPEGTVLRQAALTYDDAGNRASQTVTGTPTVGGLAPAEVANGTTTYQWDAQDRLVAVNTPGGGVHQYAYDYRTRRIATQETPASGPAKNRAIVFAGGVSLAEYEGTQSVAVTPGALPAVHYMRGPDMGGGVGGLLYSVRGATLKYSLSNGRGDIVAQSNPNRAITWQASYEAYGRRTQETGVNEDRQRANSKDEDPTGLLNEGFRYRDLETGVWLSRDPAGLVDGPNLYAYVKQNPWTSFDPDGLQGSDYNKRTQDKGKPNETKQFVSTVSDLVPGVGTVKGITEVVSGKDPVTGKPLSTGERVVSGMATVAGIAPFGKTIVGKVGKLFVRGGDDAAEVVVKNADALGDSSAKVTAGKAAALAEDAAKGPPNPGGRLGKESTRTHIDDVATEMESRGFEITGGGNRLPEEFLPGPGGGRKGSSFPDITATKNGRTVRVNTVDTRANGVTPTTREAANAARIRSQTPGDHLLLVPKPKP